MKLACKKTQKMTIKKQLYEKPDIVFLTTISELYAGKLKDNLFSSLVSKKDFRTSTYVTHY